MTWHKIAQRIGKDVDEAKEEVSSTQYLRWVELFEREWNTHEKLDYYLAAIAFEVYLCRFMLGGKPTRNFESFLHKFLTEKPEESENFDPAVIQKQIADSQAAWITGMTLTARAVGEEISKSDLIKQAQDNRDAKQGKKPKKRR